MSICVKSKKSNVTDKSEPNLNIGRKKKVCVLGSEFNKQLVLFGEAVPE